MPPWPSMVLSMTGTGGHSVLHILVMIREKSGSMGIRVVCVCCSQCDRKLAKSSTAANSIAMLKIKKKVLQESHRVRLPDLARRGKADFVFILPVNTLHAPVLIVWPLYMPRPCISQQHVTVL